MRPGPKGARAHDRLSRRRSAGAGRTPVPRGGPRGPGGDDPPGPPGPPGRGDVVCPDARGVARVPAQAQPRRPPPGRARGRARRGAARRAAGRNCRFPRTRCWRSPRHPHTTRAALPADLALVRQRGYAVGPPRAPRASWVRLRPRRRGLRRRRGRLLGAGRPAYGRARARAAHRGRDAGDARTDRFRGPPGRGRRRASAWRRRRRAAGGRTRRPAGAPLRRPDAARRRPTPAGRARRRDGTYGSAGGTRACPPRRGAPGGRAASR